jgi:hypothetical protein
MTEKPGRKTRLHFTTLMLSAALSTFGASYAVAQSPPGLEQERGLRINTDLAAPGYVMFSPIISGITYIIDNEGQVVHTWTSEYGTGHGAYLLDNGNLIRQGRVADNGLFQGGQGGQIQEFTWDGELVWDYRLANDDYLLHHDAAILPNGNILAIAWEFKSAEEARAAGRRPDALGEIGLWPEVILELEPRGYDDAEIVWEWHAWDHAIQDFDPDADNYGVLSEHPELSDINSDADELSDDELAELLAGGAVALVEEEQDARSVADNMHFNGIAYNADLDQIVVSVHDFHEFFILDHSTTSAEAAGSTGGRYGMGGDILYRWGKASNYNRGGDRPQQLYGQHHARWTEDGLPGAGNITVFNNQYPGAPGMHAIVFELEPPMNSDGSYNLEDGEAFGPDFPLWSYQAPDGKSFFAPFISGAHRLSNGHTFINSGPRGRFFEVTPKGDIVWEYWSPYSGEASLPHHEFLVEDNNPFLYAVFRALKIPPDHPGLAGRDLSPLDPQPPAIPHVVVEE